MYAQRLNLWELKDAPHDEELPDHEADAALSYDGSLFDEPLITFHLRQYDREILRAYGASAASSYRVTTNSFRVFSKKLNKNKALRKRTKLDVIHYYYLLLTIITFYEPIHRQHHSKWTTEGRHYDTAFIVRSAQQKLQRFTHPQHTGDYQLH
ncbi:hypothetical protein CC80DRAFT_537758 [Byssothecium circinans]|uniref:Uncharacterized protein n=1 Tax=Byssothecium circinans TaxID=147558 RepID=A0A6A5TWC2_9PLEO|nr:hypothetical protein CC80DRAFT_537758 [Byssothecium circinans]